MSLVDWIVLVLFLGWVVSDGVRRASGSRDLEGYFAGRRSIPWWAAGLSVMATQASAITVIGTTGQGHEGGMEFVQFYFGLPFAMVVLCVVIVPLFRRAPILTAYEYLEGRFGVATRTLASAIFLVSRCLAFGIVLLAPAVVLSALTGWSVDLTVIVIGVLTTGYTMLGGVNAVIWTDVKQMLVIIGGLLLALGIVIARMLPDMSFDGMLQVAGAAGRLQAVDLPAADASWLPRAAGTDGPRTFWDDKYNLLSGLLGGLFLHMAYFGCDHSQVQRILTNPSARESRMALLMSAFAKVPMQAFVLFLGAMLFAYHAVHEGPLRYAPVDETRIEASAVERLRQLEQEYTVAAGERRQTALALAEAGDDGARAAFHDAAHRCQVLRREANALAQDDGDVNFIFCHFLLRQVPPVLLGLIVAAIFAAAMSSADSALNSLTAASVVDFYRRLLRPGADEQHAMRASRVITLGWGTLATVSALTIGSSGSIVEFINKVGSFFYGSLLGVFLLAVLCRRAGARAGFVGLIGGMAAVMVVHHTLHVEYLWYNVIGAVGVLVVGFAVAPFERRAVAAP